MKFNHTVNTSPHETIFHEAYIYNNMCCVSSLHSLSSPVKSSVENKKKKTDAEIQIHTTLISPQIIERMHSLELICLFKLVNPSEGARPVNTVSTRNIFPLDIKWIKSYV